LEELHIGKGVDHLLADHVPIELLARALSREGIFIEQKMLSDRSIVNARVPQAGVPVGR
jgi:hypothetical protein